MSLVVFCYSGDKILGTYCALSVFNQNFGQTVRIDLLSRLSISASLGILTGEIGIDFSTT